MNHKWKNPHKIDTLLNMKVVIAPDQKLRFKTTPVKKITPKFLETLKEMEKLTKTYLDPEGVGLAATQVGLTEQFFVAKLENDKGKEKFKAYINPKIISYSKTTKLFFEGCLSIPDYYGEITRPSAVEVSYMDEQGKQIKEKLTGFPAWVFQHEYDHLQGKLFMDLVLSQKAKLFKVVGKDRAGADIFEEVGI